MISPLGAKVTRDTDTWGKGDPYCQITVGGVQKKTKPHKGGGKKPEWKGYTWEFPSNGVDAIEIKLYDEDPGTDDHIGSGTLAAKDVSKGKDK